MNYIIKRIFDVFISATLLILLLPMFFIIAIIIKIDSKGTVYFRQKRLGKNGKPFQMLKFRSMIQNAEHMGSGLFNYKNDIRITKVGKFLRNTSIDEVPQFINVLKGDMSLVGPRPPVTYELGDYKSLNKRYKKRFEIVPGITGLAQVIGRNELSWDKKVDYDNEYIERFKNEGFLLDVKIILKTIYCVSKSKNIYEAKIDENMSDIAAAKYEEEKIIKKAHKTED